MITAPQMRAARALLGIDQKKLAELAGVSLPTIQRMEASDGNVRGIIDTLSKVVEALEAAGAELIGEYNRSEGDGRGVRLRQARSAELTRRAPVRDEARVEAFSAAATRSSGEKKSR